MKILLQLNDEGSTKNAYATNWIRKLPDRGTAPKSFWTRTCMEGAKGSERKVPP